VTWRNQAVCFNDVNSSYWVSYNLDKIKYILDNSESKQENKLYGTDLICKSPNIISNIKSPVVIVSHMGVYSDEISKQLKKINKKILLL
jgi:galactitol-specific phosphotransferase system IIB component